MTSFVIEEFRPVTKPGVLRGWLTVMQPSGQRVHDCGLYCKDGRWWVSPPSKLRIGRDGQQMWDANGKAVWQPVVSFASREVGDRWSDNVLAALRLSQPELFNELALPAS
jgi:hypothetical protein